MMSKKTVPAVILSRFEDPVSHRGGLIPWCGVRPAPLGEHRRACHIQQLYGPGQRFHGHRLEPGGTRHARESGILDVVSDSPG